MGFAAGLVSGGLLEHEWDKHENRTEQNSGIFSSISSHKLHGSGIQSNAGPSFTKANLPSVTKISPLSAVTWGIPRIDVFGLGTDHAIYHRVRNGNDWHPAASWDYLGGSCSSPPVAVSWGPHRLDIFVIGSDSAMYHKA